ncbi:MAG: hypothetical protein WCQ23_03895 [Candidatus Methanomethylophilaceae archaeon]|jgi:peptidoglycan/LPS O-acetylase OafA/YrhL
MTELNSRTLSAVKLGVFIIAFAIGILLYMAVKKDVLVIVWGTLLIFGIALCILSGLSSNATTGTGPSDLMYNLVIGAVLTLVGLAGLLYSMTSLELVYIAVIVLIGIAVIGIAAALINNKKEASL